MNRSAATRALVPAAVVTRTAFLPVPRGVTAVHGVLDGHCTFFMSTAPILMAVTPVKLRPVMVTRVPGLDELPCHLAQLLVASLRQGLR